MVNQPLSYVLFEVMVLFVFIICLIRAFKTRTSPTTAVLELIVFMLYGLMVETAAVSYQFYSYAPFAFSIGHTPIVIALGWAVIGSSAMEFSDGLNMAQWAKPFLDALLALLIDLGMDAVAIRDQHLFAGERLGMWNWGLAFDEQWFGVPYANFMAWWLIIFLMSACLRSGRYLYSWFDKPWLSWAYPIAAGLSALSLFLFLLLTYAANFSLLVLILMLSLSGLITAFSLRGIHHQLSWRKNPTVFLVPRSFHVFFLGLLLWRKIYLERPVILGVSLLVFVMHEYVLYQASKPLKLKA